MAVNLGTAVTDKITGFTGIATSRTEFIHGCTRIGVQSKDLHEGKVVDLQYFDELQLVENVAQQGDKPNGGPGKCAPPPSCPKR